MKKNSKGCRSAKSRRRCPLLIFLDGGGIMKYYGNTPQWVYQQKIKDLENSTRISENNNEQKITNAIKKVLSVVDYSIISVWCDMNGYYYPIKKDFEKLEKIDELEKAIRKIEFEIEGIKHKSGLSWTEKSELENIDLKIEERKTEVMRCEESDSENLKKANKLYKCVLTRKRTLLEKKEKCEIKIVEESKPLIEKQNDLKCQIDELKNAKKNIDE